MASTSVLRVKILLTALAFLVMAASQNCGAKYVWIEAENPSLGDKAITYGWLAPHEDEKPLLSGGKWMCFDKSPDNLSFRYDFKISDKAENYDIHIRKFWLHGKFKWRIDDGQWKTPQQNLSLQDNVTLRTHISANWANLGKIKLSAGKHTLEIKTIEADTPLAIDCFCITDSIFIPRGPNKPDYKSNLAKQGYWAFEPGVDDFSDNCMLDLSYLNEDTAGQNGRVTTRDGKFYLGDGNEVRFWGVGVTPKGKTLSQLRYQAKRLAKLGVNHVRLHDTFADCRKNTDGTQIDTDLLDAAHKLVAAMRDEGIYVAISPLFILQLTTQPEWNIPHIDQTAKRPFGLIFWDKTLQNHYKSWLRQILTTNNPYTNIPLAKDPAVYLFQLQNEDSCLFWTFMNNIPQGQKDALAKQYGIWLAKKYGSLSNALKYFADGQLKANANHIHSSDDIKLGTAALLDAWHMTGKYKGPHSKRIAAQIEFIAQLQYNFNAEMANFIRQQCGYNGLINANNWRTCDDKALSDLERWTYTSCDVIDSHHYFGSPHENPANNRRSSYSVSDGDLYANKSVLNTPSLIPTNIRHIKNFPHIISESTWPQPNNYKAEAPLTIAATARATNLDGFLWFCSQGIDYESSITKFQVNIPSIMGQFPAAALIYRNNYLSESLAVTKEHCPLTRMYNRKIALLPEKISYDPNRDKKDDTHLANNALKPLSYLLGQVEIDFASKGEPKLSTPRLQKYIKALGGTDAEISSLNGEIQINTADGLMYVQAPAVAAICGKFDALNDKNRTVSLSNGAVTMQLENSYGAVTVIALDGLELTKSRKILIQAMTHDQLYGYTESPSEKPGFKKIDSLGSKLWNVRDILAKVQISNPSLTKAAALDHYGYSIKNVEFTKGSDGRISLILPPKAMYTIIE